MGVMEMSEVCDAGGVTEIIAAYGGALGGMEIGAWCDAGGVTEISAAYDARGGGAIGAGFDAGGVTEISRWRKPPESSQKERSPRQGQGNGDHHK